MLVAVALLVASCGRQQDTVAQDHGGGLDASGPPPMMPPPTRPTVLPQVPVHLGDSPKITSAPPSQQPKVMALDPPNAPIQPKALPAAAKAVSVEPDVQPIQPQGVYVNSDLPLPADVSPTKLETVDSPTPPNPLAPLFPPQLTPDSISDPNPFDNERINLLLISDNPDDNLMVLNEALKVWLMKNKGLPEMLGDLVGKQYLPMLPMAPLGKVFAIDPESNSVVLVADK